MWHGLRRHTGWSLLRALAFSLTLLVATLAGAEDLLQVAAEGDAGEQKPPAHTAPSPPPSGIEEIVVLGAESESSADFAAADSVTGFGAEDLAALGAKDVADLASFTPNLEIVTGGATTPTFFIRGVGLNDFNPNASGSVAIYHDDVAINAPALQLGSLFDVESVNVLRGPQGTGLARNASAGAIKIYSRKPSGDFGGFLRSDFGNYDYQDYEGAVEAPIYEDILSTRVAFRLTRRDGTMKNRCARNPFRVPLPNLSVPQTQAPWSVCGEAVPAEVGAISPVPFGLADKVNNINNWASRGTLLFQPTLDMTWLVSMHGSRRNELSRLGQSIGTSGNYCTRDVVCQLPRRGVPASLFDRSAVSSGLLGAAQGRAAGINNGYQPWEVKYAWAQLTPCLVFNSGPNSCPQQGVGMRLAANRAKIIVADHLASNLDIRPWEGDFNLTGPTTNDTFGAYLKGDIVLPWGLELKTTSAYDNYDRFIDIDLDFSPETLFQIKTKDKAWQFYQDASLTGQISDAIPLRWELGGWFLREKLDASVDNDFGSNSVAGIGVRHRDYVQRIKSAAGYFYFSYDFWRNFTLDGGVRYNWEQRDLDMTIVSGTGTLPEGCDFTEPNQTDSPIRCLLNDTWDAPTGTIRLTYRFREDTQAYWKYTRGWKPGTFNATASQFSGPTTAKPEELDSFETGLSGSWLEGRLGLDGSLFYYEYQNYQIFTAQQYLGGNPEFVILNANNAEVYGAEVAGVARPWSGAFLNVRFSWLETQFLDFLQRDQFLRQTPGTSSPVAFRERQNSGHPLLNSPNFKVSLTAEQTVPLGRYGSLTFRYDGAWTDTTYYDATEGRGLGDLNGNQFLPDGTIAQKAYWLHNVRASWRAPNGRFEAAFWVRNLTNQAYKTFAFDGSNFQSTTIYYVGDPRTYGVSLIVNF